MPKYLNQSWNSAALSNCALSCGIEQTDIDAVEVIMKKLEDAGTPLKFLNVDVPNGYLTRLMRVCESLRDRHPHVTIMAGNVVTPGAVEDLIVKGGVDIVKIGIDPGEHLKTGVGFPHLSAILDCSLTASSLKAHSASDANITCTGDIAKAFCAGADFVMLDEDFYDSCNSSEGCSLEPSFELKLVEIEENLRNCCAYINAKNIQDMYVNGRFIVVN